MPDCLLPPSAGDAPIPIRAVAAADLPGFLSTVDAVDRGLDRRQRLHRGVGLPPRPAVARGSGRLGPLRPRRSRRPIRAPRFFPASLSAQLPDGTYRLAGGFADPASAALAFALGAYRFTRYRKAAPAPRLVMPEGNSAALVGTIADAVYLARDLINTGRTISARPSSPTRRRTSRSATARTIRRRSAARSSRRISR